MTTLTLPPIPTLILCIFVLFVGIYINQRIKLLGNSNIPPSVTGGVLFSALTAALYFIGGVQLLFDMQIRDFLLLVFFSTIGLAAKLSSLASGGRALGKLVAVAAVFLVLQDVIGMAIAAALSEPRVCVCAGAARHADPCQRQLAHRLGSCWQWRWHSCLVFTPQR